MFSRASLFIQVSAESANEFGELVADPVTHELLHYTEKPETFVCLRSEALIRSKFFDLFFLLFLCELDFYPLYLILQVSDLINCGVYVFTPDIFTAIQGVSTQRKDRGRGLLRVL